MSSLAVVVYLATASGNLPDAGAVDELGRSLGFISLVPTLLAVALAFLTGDVVSALLVGLVMGELMLAVISGGGFAGVMPGILITTVSEIAGTVPDADNAEVLILCALVGGMVGVLRILGGFECAATRLLKKINTPRKANLLGQLFCMVFFFDDYANALVSGPVLQPITDKNGISRERLSYIVDSTAAPMAGIAVISSWVAVEISVIAEGFDVAGCEISPFAAFLNSIPYCFYCIFALAFIFITTILGREYGPMLDAERRARKGETLKKGSNVAFDSSEVSVSGKEKTRIAIAFSCIGLLLAYALISFVFTDQEILDLLLQAALFCGIIAVVLGTVTGIFNMSDGVKAWLDGASSLMPTIVILVLAWSLASVVARLGTVYYVVDIMSAGVSWKLIPVLIFVCCCAVSFATGSYGCMFMIMPMAVPVAFAVCGLHPEIEQGKFLYLCIASVLSGGIFGDHCSPMTDCTILAALGSGCETMDHVVTQMPYALTVAAVTILSIFITTAGLNVFISALIGIILLTLIIRTIGKKP